MITDLVDNWRITVALRNPNDPKKIVKTGMIAQWRI